MGLVLALRMLTWGALVGFLALTLFVESMRNPNLLGYVALPSMLALYLLGSGQVLLMIRLSTWQARASSLGPVVTVLLLLIPGLRMSPVLISLAMGLGLWFYLGAYVRQTHEMLHPRAWHWFGRTRLALLALMALVALLPNVASRLTTFCGLLFLGATVAGWRLWLGELRRSISEREEA